MESLSNRLKKASKENKLANQERKNLQNDFNDLQKVVNTFKAYDKNSYVRVSDITTISKLRIERINKYDPSGKIRLSSQQMALISRELLKLYLNKFD